MHRQQRQRTTDLLRSQNTARALFAHRESVTWLTGFYTSIEVGYPHHFAGAPHLVWYEDGHYTLIVPDIFAEAAHVCADDDVTVRTYHTYRIDQPIASANELYTVLVDLLGSSNTATEVGIEKQFATALLHDVLTSHYPNAKMKNLDGALMPLRMIKTDEEIAKLRRNFELTDIGHATARNVIRAGMREIDVWGAIHAAIDSAAGLRVALGNDLVVGSRNPNNIGGPPEAHEIRPGDSVTVDLSTIWAGYWSDSCMTYYAGERTERQDKVHRFVREALDYAISLIRPGVVAKDVDAQVRAFIEKGGYPVYPHHTGHGVGAGGHEEPRIVPYNDTVLREGMVIMLEPGVYFPGELSVRMEDGLLITSDGVEVLTHHSKD
jgi:Xaa-Pro dipeptidase